MIESKKLAPGPDCGRRLSPRALFRPGCGRVLVQEIYVRVDVVDLLDRVNAALKTTAAEARWRVLRRLIGAPATVAAVLRELHRLSSVFHPGGRDAHRR